MTRSSLLLLLLLAAGAAAAPPRVEVTFEDASRYPDVRDGYTQTPQARAFYLAALERHLTREAVRRMAQDETLKVAVTSVDLAGDYRAEYPRATNVRVVRDVTPARIDLRFRLSGGTAGVREGTRELRSAGYPAGSNPADPLNYEKALIDAWLDAELPATR